MTVTGGHKNVEPLQLIETRNDLIPNKCIWKCAGACFHEAPNERNGRDSFAEIIERRLSRRGLLKGMAAATVPLILVGTPLGSSLLSPLTGGSTAEAAGTTLGFAPIALHTADSVVAPAGYSTKVILRWGDPLHAGVPRMGVDNLSPGLASLTFGYNNDLNVFFRLEGSRGGLMAVNHEYTEGARMFRSYVPADVTKDQVDIELAAHGMSIVELTRSASNDWGYNLSSPYNRRITAASPIEIKGPLAGDARMKTSYDPDGTTVFGMLNNCSGGRTPWGTVLTAEENFNQYFANNDNLPDGAQKTMNKRYGVTAKSTERQWENVYKRFDCAIEPNEVNRFGYIVEVDPYDPTFVPKKRTALGRFKHEAASVGIAASGQAVVYMGDDERFDYLYKFVSKDTYSSEFRKMNFELLDEGTLYVAKFNDNGSGEWIPLDPAQRPELWSWSTQDVLLNTRGAGDAVKATPMDRPEDVEINPTNNRVYMVCTNNTNRTADRVDTANPRPNNAAGHIIEIEPGDGDHGSRRFEWNILLLCGDPNDPSTYFAGFDKTQVSAIAAPDNIAFDGVGNLWIATDGQFSPIKKNDAIFAVPVAGPERGKVQAFLNSPAGSEMCGPEFSPDFEAFFANIQHPGENGKGPNDPQSLWPDGVWPALPSLVVVTKNGGGRIGS